MLHDCQGHEEACKEYFTLDSIFSWEVGDRDSLAPFPQAAIDNTAKPYCRSHKVGACVFSCVLVCVCMC